MKVKDIKIYSTQIEELRKDAERQIEYYSKPGSEISYRNEFKITQLWLEITNGDGLDIDELAEFARIAYFNKYVGSILFRGFCCETKKLYLNVWKQYLEEKYKADVTIHY